MAKHILIVGAGMTGALAASEIHRRMPSVVVSVWDKARREGGRMTTSISPKNHLCTADIGAQYISTKLSQHSTIYKDLVAEGLLEPLAGNVVGMQTFPPDTLHYVAPNGMGSLVQKFLNDIPQDNISFGHHVDKISNEGHFVVKAMNGKICEANIVVLTIPIPQLFLLEGSIKEMLAEVMSGLVQVSYSTRFVLVLYFEGNDALPQTDWHSKYITGDDTFRYVSIDNLKRNRPNAPIAAVLHTSVDFGRRNITKTKSEMEEELVKSAERLFPEWPKPSAIKCHKWRYSQVVEPFPGRPGCVSLGNGPLLILGGDGFSQSNFDGCVASAQAIAQTVMDACNR